jgi:hypothetical protein
MLRWMTRKSAFPNVGTALARLIMGSRIARPGPVLFVSGAPGTIRTCGLYLRRVALYPAELRVPVTRNYSSLITPVNDALTRLKPVRVAEHLMAFTCPRLRRSFRQGGCNVGATLPVNVDPKTSPSLTSSIHYQNRPTKLRPALTLSPSEGSAARS